jgi:hypothetical protein
MSENSVERAGELAAALKAAQIAKTEAYLASDWTRLWEISNEDIPRLEQEIADLTKTGDAEASQPVSEGINKVQPLDFKHMSIQMIETKNSFLNIHLRRQARTRKSQIKIVLAFSPEQRRIVVEYLLDHVVFYQSNNSKPVKASAWLAGSWTSDEMIEEHVEKTAENARQGIDDLRLIMQARARGELRGPSHPRKT